MKFYDEARMSGIRRTLEDEILHWPGVTSREMMGCLCYFHGKSFFAFLVTQGIVITKLPPNERATVVTQLKAEPFTMAGRSVKTWVKVPLEEPKGVSQILPFVKKSYQTVSNRRA